MWSDQDTSDDYLGFSSYVEVLAKVATHERLAPLTLGVFGSWGSGKTSLMRMLRNKIDGTEGEHTLTLWFNAWRYEGKEEAQSALIHAIIGAIEKKLSIKGELKALASKVLKGASVLKLSKFIAKSAITLTPDIDAFLNVFQDESRQLADTMESFEDDFAELLKQVSIERIVVFIDDLDRCSSSKVIETFETIKLFLDIPSCTFVIGADAARIEAAVGDVYSVAALDSRARRDYLEKIIQVPFNIPQQRLEDIGAYVAMLLMCRDQGSELISSVTSERSKLLQSEALLAECEKLVESNKALLGDNYGAIRQDLEATVPYVRILASGLKGNPRQIKRFLNILSIRRQLADANELEIDSELLIKIGVIEYLWEGVFRVIADTVDPVSGKSELLTSMLDEEHRDELKDESPILAAALQDTGALQFITAEPALSSKLDLRPYMFLAQTSLSRQAGTDLQQGTVEIQQLVSGIESEDRIVSKTSAQRSSGLDQSAASTIVSTLLQRFSGYKSTKVKTHVIMSLDIIAERHPNFYQEIVLFLAKSKDLPTAASLFIPDLLDKAGKQGVEVDASLSSRFKSPIGGFKSKVKR